MGIRRLTFSFNERFQTFFNDGKPIRDRAYALVRKASSPCNRA